MLVKLGFLLAAALCLVVVTEAEIKDNGAFLNELKNLNQQVDNLHNDMVNFQSSVIRPLRRTLDNKESTAYNRISSLANRQLRDISNSAWWRRWIGIDASHCVQQAQYTANYILSTSKSRLSTCSTKHLSAIDSTDRDMDIYFDKCTIFKDNVDRIESICASSDATTTNNCLDQQLITAEAAYNLLQLESATLKETANEVSRISIEDINSCVNATVPAAIEATLAFKRDADQCIRSA